MDLKEKLKSEMGPSSWEDLNPFIPRGTLVYLTDELDIIDVGFKMATNDAQAIKELIESKKLIKPDPEMFAKWQNNKFECLIVDPFVLCKLIA